MAEFADISHHQEDRTAARDVDLAAYARAGRGRIAMKATQGRSYTDPRFTAWWRQAGQLGLARVAYHFAENEDRGADDFDHFIAAVRAAGPLRPGRAPDGEPWDVLCLDSEDPPDIARAEVYAREFVARAAVLGYRYGWLYTGRWYANPARLTPDDVPGWPLWISDYGTAADGQIMLPAGWPRSAVVARQYTSQARVPGIAGPCDASRLLASQPPTPTTPGTVPTQEDDLTMDAETRKYLDQQFATINHGLGVLMWGDAPDNQKNPDGSAKDRGGHPFNLEAIRNVGTIQSRQLAELTATNRVLVEQLAAQHPNLTAEQITDAVAAGVVRVRVEITGQQQPDQADPPPAPAPAEGGQA